MNTTFLKSGGQWQLTTQKRTKGLSNPSGAFILSQMKNRAMFWGSAMMGFGILSAFPLHYFGHAIVAGAIFVAGMLLLWVCAITNFFRRLWRPNRDGR